MTPHVSSPAAIRLYPRNPTGRIMMLNNYEKLIFSLVHPSLGQNTPSRQNSDYCGQDEMELTPAGTTAARFLVGDQRQSPSVMSEPTRHRALRFSEKKAVSGSLGDLSPMHSQGYAGRRMELSNGKALNRSQCIAATALTVPLMGCFVPMRIENFMIRSQPNLSRDEEKSQSKKKAKKHLAAFSTLLNTIVASIETMGGGST
ncbi:hypothetical protein GX51_04714 [Blastomyces parvus]|uniref:Uncharacterized protein n=1 Tax=Blastomyces parvus TaxID=2060905 RepID=A0A2B7WSA9_9EURO|nr:hypothetical protein GX51_04714 [Blastomyces parvus]